MEAIRFTNTLVDEIRIDDSSRYPLDEFVQEDDPSKQYQANPDFSYYIIPHGHSLTKLTQVNHVPKVIALNEQDAPYTVDVKGPPDLINTEGTQEQNVQDEQINHQITKGTFRNNTKTSDRWSRDQHIELVNIIGDPGEGMLSRSMSSKLITASASKCLFVDFLSKMEPKKNKVWTLVPLSYRKIAIGFKWVFRNKKDEHEILTKNKARLVAQDYSQEEGIDYDETFAPMARMEAIGTFLAFATYMNFIVFQMDVKSIFLNGNLNEEVFVKQPPGLESGEFLTMFASLTKPFMD
nr:hypothetical protein [Tanacetum cinerariifolium]